MNALYYIAFKDYEDEKKRKEEEEKKKKEKDLKKEARQKMIREAQARGIRLPARAYYEEKGNSTSSDMGFDINQFQDLIDEL